MSKPKQFRDLTLDITGDVVGFYEREFYPFSNFLSFQVQYQGRLWATSEHAYQAAHFFETSPELVETIHLAKSAHDAFKIAKASGSLAVSNWDEIKIPVMSDICSHKLAQHPYIESKLRQTGDIYLVEDSCYDSFWGWGADRNGRNELGKIWMRLRDELKM